MSLHAVNIQGINITNSSKKEILESLNKFLVNGSWFTRKINKNHTKIVTIVTPNPEQLVLAQGNMAFKEVLNKADVALPDGIGLVWASNMLSKLRLTINGSRITNAIPGVDFMEELVSIAAKQHVPIALIGSKSKVAVSAFECLQQRHSDLLGVAMEAPEFEIRPSGLVLLNHVLGIMNNGKKFTENNHNSSFSVHYSNKEDYFKKVANVLHETGCRIVFVALGAPKQEYFIEKLRMSLTVNRKPLTGKKGTISANNDSRLAVSWLILMSVGGSFDEISGRVPRAPDWVSRVGMKWLWRLMLEPWRIRRQFALVKFVWMVIKEKLSGRSR